MVILNGTSKINGNNTKNMPSPAANMPAPAMNGSVNNVVRPQDRGSIMTPDLQYVFYHPFKFVFIHHIQFTILGI
jgi:hypothetical protein